MKATDANRFWSKVRKTDGCWLWTAATDDLGYGVFSIDGRLEKAHRVAWRLVRGEIPPGHGVLHHCDVPNCVRIEVDDGHLFTGTQDDNMKDCRDKGRARGPTGQRHGSQTHPETFARGERSGMAKLTEEAVLEICRLYAAGGVRQVDLARQFKVSRGRIGYVVRRETWKHVLRG